MRSRRLRVEDVKTYFDVYRLVSYWFQQFPTKVRARPNRPHTFNFLALKSNIFKKNYFFEFAGVVQ